MLKRYVVLMLAVYFASCHGAASSVEVAELLFALHNPKKSAQVHDLGADTFKEGFELLFWPTEKTVPNHTIGFMGNTLYLNGMPILSPLSVHVDGGAAEDPFMGPEDQPRVFKYLPALRYFVLQHTPKPVEGRDFISIDSLESVNPQIASSVNVEPTKAKQRKNKAAKYIPGEIQQMKSLAEVLVHYQTTENPALIIDLKAALTRCNPNWEYVYPIRQIPMVLTYSRGNISCRPYEDMTRAQIEAHEKEEREQSSSCSVL